MVNQIIVSSVDFGDSINRVNKWIKINKSNPNTVTVNGTVTKWVDWKAAYDKTVLLKIGNYTFLEFLDSYYRVKTWQKNHNEKNPATVKVKNTTMDWCVWYNLHLNIFKKTNITIVIPDTPKKDEETNKTGIIPVWHFNQQTVPRMGEYCCGPTASLIAASNYDVVNFSNFQSKVAGLMVSMKTTYGSGTTPINLVKGFNEYFTTLNMEEVPFSESNIEKYIKKNVAMVINLLTNANLGYRQSRVGHYVTITGYKDGKIGLSDPHGFNIGRGYRYWYSYNTIKNAVNDNGSRPIWLVTKK